MTCNNFLSLEVRSSKRISAGGGIVFYKRGAETIADRRPDSPDSSYKLFACLLNICGDDFDFWVADPKNYAHRVARSIMAVASGVSDRELIDILDCDLDVWVCRGNSGFEVRFDSGKKTLRRCSVDKRELVAASEQLSKIE